MMDFDALKKLCQTHGQEHLLRYWVELGEASRTRLLNELNSVDFDLLSRLVKQWVTQTPPPEQFTSVEPIPLIPAIAGSDDEDARMALEAGEDALRQGKVGIFLVAGGQGTRLGFEGPKGTYPIGPLTGKSFFQYHAEKIHNLQLRYSVELPWYLMVSRDNAEATRAYFEQHDFFDLNKGNILFIEQQMMPCVDAQGKILLAAKDSLARNPNGHGGCIAAIAQGGVLEHARTRGIEYLSYFQVDNWAAKVIDPYFMGYHVSRSAQMSSKVHLKTAPHESVGVHCLCDGEYRIIEYSELDLYPQLLETDAQGKLRFNAGNSAIHILSLDFIEHLSNTFDQFPWHVAHKKIPFINVQGELEKPHSPNGYKFETFVFDALRFSGHAPVALTINRAGEYTPTKQFEGPNSVVAARQQMSDYWAGWLEQAGALVPRDENGHSKICLEISPKFAFDAEEFVQKKINLPNKIEQNTAIDEQGILTFYP